MLQRADRVAHLNARDDLLGIARDWPVLATRLAAGAGPSHTGMPRLRMKITDALRKA